jgi:hypothetical protein
MEDSVDERFCYICPAGFELEDSANSLERVLISAGLHVIDIRLDCFQ